MKGIDMKKLYFVMAACVGISFLAGCTNYKPIYEPPRCDNPYHKHYREKSLHLYKERITTDTYEHKVEERFWRP